MDNTKIYNRLATLRADHNLSRKALAEILSVNYQTIGYIERGDYKPSLVLALQIAKHFDLPVEAIFSLEPLKPLSHYFKGKD